MLDENRWPEWAEEALRRGMRSSVYLVRQFPPMTLVLGLFGVRPAVLDADSVPMAQTLARFGGMVFANTLAYGEAQRTATQLPAAVNRRITTPALLTRTVCPAVAPPPGVAVKAIAVPSGLYGDDWTMPANPP